MSSTTTGFTIHSGGPSTIRFAIWPKNRTSTRILSGTTPYERHHSEKPVLAGLPGTSASGCTVALEPSSAHEESRADARLPHFTGLKNTQSVSATSNSCRRSCKSAKGVRDASSTLANQPQFSQQGEESFSAVTNTTKVDPVSHAPTPTQSKILAPTTSRPRARRYMALQRRPNSRRASWGVDFPPQLR